MPPFKIVFAALAAVLACPLVVSAQEAKKTTGTIIAMEAGDIACYLTMHDDAGARFRELAEFEICEQRGLLNKRVALTYKQGRVQSDECQGNPDCSKSRTVMLVVAARAIGPAAAAAAPAAASLCSASETVVFSCPIGGKMASVCTSHDATANRGTLLYRFGKSGEVELTLPESATVPARSAIGDSVPFSGGGGAWLSFRKGAIAYSVYDGIGNWGPRGQKKTVNGVLVEQSGKRLANLKCSVPPQSELGPALFEKLGIKGGKQDFNFPTED